MTHDFVCGSFFGGGLVGLAWIVAGIVSLMIYRNRISAIRRTINEHNQRQWAKIGGTV